MTADSATRVKTECVRLLYARAPKGMLASALNSVFLIVMLRGVVPLTKLLSWLGINLLILAARFVLVNLYRRCGSVSESTVPWEKYFVLGIGASGIAMGSAGVLLYPADAFAHQVFLVFFLAIAVALGTVLYSNLKAAFFAYGIPVLAPIIFWLLTHGTRLEMAIAVILLLFFAVMYSTASFISATTQDSLVLRFQNMDLIEDLTSAKNRADQVIEELQHEIAIRRKAEKAMEENEHQYRRLVETMNEGLGVQDENGLITYVNDRLCSMLGSSRLELLGRPVTNFLPPGTRDLFENVTEDRLKRLKKKMLFETELLTTAGRLLPTMVSASPIFDRKGLFKGVIYVITDNSVRKRAEKRLQDQLHFLQMLIDTIPNPIFYKDMHGRYLGCNKAFEERVGIDRAGILGKTAHDLYPPIMAEAYAEMDMKLLEDPGQQMHETTLLYAQGTTHNVIINKGTFTDAEGVVVGLVGVVMDITERKQAEDALRRTRDDLEERVRERTAELAKANEELWMEVSERIKAEQALLNSSEKLKLFAYSIAHDLKSPAIGIYGLTRVLHSNYCDILDERGRNICEQVLKASEHVASLAEEINVFVSAKESPLNVEQLHFNEILHMVREEFSARLSLLRVAWSQDNSVPVIHADRIAMLRVLRNLVDNALKYGGEDLAEIRISYADSDLFHLFSVRDDGVGVSREKSERIFGLFQRDGDTAKGVEGSGLGLAIVREIVERHGGRVWIEPVGDKGTTFCFTIAKALANRDTLSSQ